MVLGPAALGVTISLLIASIDQPSVVEALFGGFCLCVAVKISIQQCFGQNQTFPSKFEQTVELTEAPQLGSLVVAGLLGGLSVGYIGVGVETLTFVALQYCGATLRQSTVTAIAAIGATSAFALAIHVLVLQDMDSSVWHRWIAILPGIAIGARCAPKVNMALGQKMLLSMLVVLLLLSSLKAFSSALSTHE